MTALEQCPVSAELISKKSNVMCMKSQFRLIVFFHFGDGFIDSVQANKGH